ncbi:MAG: sodium:solute symporter [Planctomycetes bacterium]|nr:sodium:solute symporter [Planctomycetota bacterium]
MENLNAVDYGVIAVYFAFLVALGLILKKRASASLEDYYLGGRRLPWWMLGVSGMAHFLDITGTLLIVSFLFLLGPRGLFVEFRGGAVLVLPVFLLWAGKWHRRSGCMTGAEWMIFRFGDGFGGQFARIACSASRVIFTIGMLAYMVKGVGLFLSMFLPFSPLVCALIMIGVATTYTMFSGFYGVVFTDLFQALIILIAVFTISIMAFLKVPDSASLGALAEAVTGSSEWLSSRLSWKTTMPAGTEYEAFQSLAMFAMFYLFRMLVGGTGEADDPKFFGARSDSECGKLTFLWTWLMAFRWPMMMGFAVLGLYLVQDLFPDRSVLAAAADLIRERFPGITKGEWAEAIASIRLRPDAWPQLVEGLRDLFGEEWSNRLNLVGFEGGVDPERILPGVILFCIPKGVRGLIVVALVAASMSTFDSQVNRGLGYFVRDIYQRYLRPSASTRELMLASWASGVSMVAMGFLLGYSVRSVNQIWGWIIMGLGGGMLVPLFLRFFWWRFNGGGFAAGMAAGLVGAITLHLVKAPLIARSAFWTFLDDDRWQFCITFAIGLAGSLAGTYLTRPTDPAVLEHFYRTTRPFGAWGPLKRKLSTPERRAAEKEHRSDLMALPFNVLWQVTLFLIPMQIIIHAFGSLWITGSLFAICLAGMYFFWWRNLPGASAELKRDASPPVE